MVFYSLEGKIQATGDFLVSQSLCNKRSELVFARSQVAGRLRANDVQSRTIGDEVEQGSFQMLWDRPRRFVSAGGLLPVSAWKMHPSEDSLPCRLALP